MARKYMKIAMVGQKRVPSRDGGIEVGWANWPSAWWRRGIP